VRALAVVVATLLSAMTVGCASNPEKPQPAKRDCKPTAQTISYRALACDGVLLGGRCYTWIIGLECKL